MLTFDELDFRHAADDVQLRQLVPQQTAVGLQQLLHVGVGIGAVREPVNVQPVEVGADSQLRKQQGMKNR